MNIKLPGMSSGSPALAVLGVVLLIISLFLLARALKRRDLDPVTKLMWVLVIIMVPIFGSLFYIFIAPDEAETAAAQNVAPPDEPTKCMQCRAQIPGNASACPQCGWSYTVKQNG